MSKILSISLIFFVTVIYSQESGKIYGSVMDHINNEPLIGATIQLTTCGSCKGVISDTNGLFTLTNVPYGNHSLLITYVGFESQIINDIGVYDNKGTVLSVYLKESSTSLDEVVIEYHGNPTESGNPLSHLSSRKISIEETKRFAGGLGDPSRLALSYAGVNSGRGDDNNIIVRGNSSKFLKWQLEGLEIPNPNHFGTHGNSGGLINILNSNVIGNSDFYLGAAPANIGSALSGVFNLSLRDGNWETYKHSFETSLIGLTASSEGPISTHNNSQYNVNYRYSTLGLLKEAGLVFQAPEYQDLTFKTNFKNSKNGTLSIYGFGGLGKSLEQDFFRKIDSTKVSTGASGRQVYGFDEISGDNLNRYDIGVIGVKYTQPIKDKYMFSNHLNFSVIHNSPRETGLDKELFQTYLKSEGNFYNYTLRYRPEVTIILNERNVLNIGVISALDKFNSKLTEGYPDLSTEIKLDFSSFNFTGESFIAIENTLAKDITAVLGIHQIYHSLSDQNLIEPRGSIKYQFDNNSSIAFASGLYSSAGNPELYFNINDDLEVKRNNLNMTRSLHHVLSYKKQIAKKLFFTGEIYYQYLFDVPVASDSSNFSLINEEIFFAETSLINKGEGINYGLEITLEKMWDKNYYFLITTSFFQSEYQLLNSLYRTSRFSNSYTINFLGGKEFRVKSDRFFSINVRSNVSGGAPYTPVLLNESIQSGLEVRDDRRAYFERLPPYIGVDFSLNYRWINPKVSHELKLDIFRLFEQNYVDQKFVPEQINFNGNVEEAKVVYERYGENGTATTLLPVLAYKITF